MPTVPRRFDAADACGRFPAANPHVARRRTPRRNMRANALPAFLTGIFLLVLAGL